jgi:hypothetical protein
MVLWWGCWMRFRSIWQEGDAKAEPNELSTLLATRLGYLFFAVLFYEERANVLMGAWKVRAA